MTIKILIRNYSTEDTQALACIYYNTIHRTNPWHFELVVKCDFFVFTANKI